MRKFAGVIVKTPKGLLLGREFYGKDKGLWSAFGGKLEPSDTGNYESCAFREFHEETMGLFQGKLFYPPARLVITPYSYQYIIHLELGLEHQACAKFLDLRASYIQQHGETYSPCLEKDQLVIVPFDRLYDYNLRNKFRADLMYLMDKQQ